MSDQPRSDTSSTTRTLTVEPPSPVAYRDVFASREFRGLFAASALSWFGDYVARAAITALVYHQTGSVVASATAFALSYLPWLAGGPVLAALADRYPYRKVMITCDLVRMLLVGIVALPGTPVWAMFLLIFATALLNPPFDAARSALTPQILAGDRYVLGLGAQNSALQTAQILGYFTGGVLSHGDARLALGLNAVSFGVSALLLALFVRDREPAVARAARRHILLETREGIAVVFGQPVLRAIALVVFVAITFVAVPEGLAAGWAGAMRLGGDAQGLIMASAPAGMALGGLVFPRWFSPATRRRSLRFLAFLGPVALVPALFDPPLPVVMGMVAVAGFVCGSFLPVANGLFVQALVSSHRARAFGVMATGTQLIQGAALLITGALTALLPVPVVVGVWALGGLVLLGLISSAAWPKPDIIDSTIAETTAVNEASAKLAG